VRRGRAPHGCVCLTPRTRRSGDHYALAVVTVCSWSVLR
jgi:hypothetical protein